MYHFFDIAKIQSNLAGFFIFIRELFFVSLTLICGVENRFTKQTQVQSVSTQGVAKPYINNHRCKVRPHRELLNPTSTITGVKVRPHRELLNPTSTITGVKVRPHRELLNPISTITDDKVRKHEYGGFFGNRHFF
jgi:hypothetical protein